MPENTSFEIGKTGIIPVSVLTIQYRIGNTSDKLKDSFDNDRRVIYHHIFTIFTWRAGF
jgi:hypothetical protein